jgi:hypothetical protein
LAGLPDLLLLLPTVSHQLLQRSRKRNVIDISQPRASVYARDIFQTCFVEGPLDVANFRRYRTTVLEKGGGSDELASLREILGGRLPNGKAFTRAIDEARISL